MRGLLVKNVREAWLATLLFSLGYMAFMALLTYVLPQVLSGMETIFQRMPFVKTLIGVLLGTEIGGTITTRTMQAFIWVHPVALALVWAHEIMLCTRMPAGEIDRGTIDVLLGWPVSRRQVYMSQSIVWLVSGIWILAMGLIGHRLSASLIVDSLQQDLSREILVMANFLCLYLAVGGITLLVSACSDRRSHAVAIVFALLLISFLLSFLAQFWDPARHVSFLCVLKYYQPANLLQTGQLPGSDFAVLLGIGGVSWLLGCEIVARRSICTV